IESAPRYGLTVAASMASVAKTVTAYARMVLPMSPRLPSKRNGVFGTSSRSSMSACQPSGPYCWQALIELRDEVPNTPFLFDGKRGDMGNTMRAYAVTVFATLAVDAATVNPYLGADSIEEFTRYEDRGVYIVCRSSNPGAADLQHLDADGRPLYKRVAELAERLNAHRNVGLVVGATAPTEIAAVRRLSNLPFLVPGIGAQGGDLEGSVRAAWNGDPASCLVSASRSVIFAEKPSREAAKAKDAINAVVGALR